MNYKEWSSLKVGDKVKDFTYGKGIIISAVGVGYIVKFDSGKTVRISDGGLKICRWIVAFMRWFLCGKDSGNSYHMKTSLIENMRVGLIIIKAGENIKEVIGEQQEEN